MSQREIIKSDDWSSEADARLIQLVNSGKTIMAICELMRISNRKVTSRVSSLKEQGFIKSGVERRAEILARATGHTPDQVRRRYMSYDNAAAVVAP